MFRFTGRGGKCACRQSQEALDAEVATLDATAQQLQEQILHEEEAVATLKERTHAHGAARVLFSHDVSLEGLTNKVFFCLPTLP
jgi:hypothetical protein